MCQLTDYFNISSSCLATRKQTRALFDCATPRIFVLPHYPFPAQQPKPKKKNRKKQTRANHFDEGAQADAGVSSLSAFQAAQAELDPMVAFAGGAKQRAVEVKALRKFQVSSHYGLADFANCLPISRPAFCDV